MDPTNTLATQGTTILLIPLFVQWIKKSRWFPWISHETEALNRALAWALGVISAVGIHWVAEWDGGVFRLSIDFTAVTFGAVVHQAAVIGGQLGGQQFVYRILRTGELIEQALNTTVALQAQKEKP